ncbi:MAG TPA: sialate O-acetylesterase [Flavipsychrobacter sp.]|nr:sialate O-acetylesterase [Flavipsychrobacter sp.]
MKRIFTLLFSLCALVTSAQLVPYNLGGPNDSIRVRSSVLVNNTGANYMQRPKLSRDTLTLSGNDNFIKLPSLNGTPGVLLNNSAGTYFQSIPSNASPYNYLSYSNGSLTVMPAAYALVYTPTITNVSNIILTSISSGSFDYVVTPFVNSRFITVTGRILIYRTSAGSEGTISFKVPIISNFSSYISGTINAEDFDNQGYITSPTGDSIVTFHVKGPTEYSYYNFSFNYFTDGTILQAVPSLVSATVPDSAKNRIDLLYDIPLNSASAPAKSAFPVVGKVVDSVYISGYRVHVLLTDSFSSTDYPNIGYTVPGSNKLQSTLSVPAVSFSNYYALNLVRTQIVDVTPPSLTSATIFNSNAYQVVLDYNKTLNSSIVPATSSFTATANSTSSVSISADKVYVNFSSPFSSGATVNLNYTAGTNKIQDLFGNIAPNLVNHLVTNNVVGDITAPTIVSAAIYNANKKLIILKASENLNASYAATTGSFGLSHGKTVTSVTFSSDSIYLLANTDYSDTNTSISVSYTPGSNYIRDIAGNQLASFTTTVTNHLTPQGQFPTIVNIGIVRGQSNARGTGAVDGNSVEANLDVWGYSTATNDISHLEEPYGNNPEGISTDYSGITVLGNTLTDLTGVPTILIKVAKGSTSIDEFIDTTSPLHYRAVAVYDSLVQYCQDHEIQINLRFTHYLQGENDALTMSTEQYSTKLNQFINLATRSFDSMQFVAVTRIGPDASATSGQTQNIQLAQKRINFSRDEAITTTYAAAAFTTGNGKLKLDGVHYTALGYNEVNEDVAQVVYNWYSNSTKKALTENVSDLQDPPGSFDDIYLFRSLKDGYSNTTYDELFSRNNLSKEGAGTGTFDGRNGLNVSGSLDLQPDTVRYLTDTTNWTLEFTFSISSGEGMFMNGSEGGWTEHWLWVTDASHLSLKANGVTTNVDLSGADLTETSNVALVYTHADSTLKVYVNGGIKQTITSWDFDYWKIESFLRGYTASPSILFGGNVQRIRVANRVLSTYEFDNTYFNQPDVTSTIDWLFSYNNTVEEASGSVSVAFYDYEGVTATPTYSGGAIVLNSDGYSRLGTAASLPGDFRIQWTGTRTDSLNDDFITGKSPDNSDGSYDRRLAWSAYYLIVDGGTGFDMRGIDIEAEHTYTIVYDDAAETLTVFVDGEEFGSQSRNLDHGLLINTIGAGHISDGYGYKGTLKDFSIKNFID